MHNRIICWEMLLGYNIRMLVLDNLYLGRNRHIILY